MMIGRREFFERLTHNIIDQINLAAVKKTTSIVFAQSSKNQNLQSEWIVVAKQSEMVPGIEKKVSIKNLSFTLHSSSEGVWAEQYNGARVAIRTEAPDAIAINPKIAWPVDRVLSHITGELIDLVQNNKDKVLKVGDLL